MKRENKLLVIVDYQVDFAAPDGALTAGAPALEIEDYLDARVKAFLDEEQDVVFTLDTHTRDAWQSHPESAAFPIHCERGTPGWAVYGKLRKYLSEPNVTTLEKAAYCPEFAALEGWVRRYDTIELMGLVTNICVLHTAVGLYTAKVNLLSPARLIVREQGCASFDAEAHRFALNHMLGTLGMGDNLFR